MPSTPRADATVPSSDPPVVFLLSAVDFGEQWLIGAFAAESDAQAERQYIRDHGDPDDERHYAVHAVTLGRSNACLHVHLTAAGHVTRTCLNTITRHADTPQVLWHLPTAWPDGTVALVAARSVADAQSVFATSTPAAPAPTDA